MPIQGRPKSVSDPSFAASAVTPAESAASAVTPAESAVSAVASFWPDEVASAFPDAAEASRSSGNASVETAHITPVHDAASAETAAQAIEAAVLGALTPRA